MPAGGDLPNLVIAHRQTRARPDPGLHEVNVCRSRSTVTPVGPSRRALTASSPSISGAPLFLPAAGGDDSVRHHADPAVAEVRDVQVPRAVHRDIRRQRDPGDARRAAVAGVDAGRAHAGRGGDGAVRAHAADAPVEGVGDVQVPRGVHGHALRAVQPRIARRAAIAGIAAHAGPRHRRDGAVRRHLAHHFIIRCPRCTGCRRRPPPRRTVR